MRVLLINTVCGIRSTGRIAADLAEGYIAQGHEVRIAYGREAVPEKYQGISYRIGSEINVRVHGLKARVFDNEGLNARRQTSKFLNWAEGYDPDVLWLHNLHGYYLNIELLFAWIKGRPSMEVRWTLHDCWAITGHCAHFDYIKCERWQKECYECPQKKEYPTSLLADHSDENYRRKKAAFCGVKNMTVITPSHWLEKLVKQSFLKEYPVEVVHNAIDTAVFKPTQGDFRQVYGLQEKKIVLGVASVWHNRKGLSDFIRLADFLDESFVIVLVGLSPNQVDRLPATVIGIQRTDTVARLAEIYTTANVFVNLTYEDTYPTVNLEAQACGTPCLTYRTGGSVESVPPENVVDQGDLVAMAARIQEICARGLE